MERKILFKLFLGLFFCITLFQLKGQNPLSVLAVANQNHSTHAYLHDFLKATDTWSTTENVQVQQEFEGFIHKLSRKQLQYKSPRSFLKYVYYKVHRKYLHQYQSPVNFADLFRKGQYDCLTGTALYAMVFTELGFKYDITETTHHVYLTVYADGQPILIESTNAMGGFMDDPETMGLMLKSYRQGYNSADGGFYQFKTPVYQNINLYQLSGLHYLNLALDAYNGKQLTKALHNMEQALMRYPSNRAYEVMGIMLTTLEKEEHVDQGTKQYFLSRYAQPQLGASSRH